MNTLGDKTKRVVRKQETRCITDAYIAKVPILNGTIVKIDGSTGEIEPVVASTDVPFGIVEVGCTVAGREVTVITQFNTIIRAKLDAAFGDGIGTYLTATEVDAPSKLQVYAATQTDELASAILLSFISGASGEAYVGILRTFVPFVYTTKA